MRRLASESSSHDGGNTVRHRKRIFISNRFACQAVGDISCDLDGDAIHSMTPVGGMGANTALRDARLLCHKLVRVHHGEEPLFVSLQEYEQAMLKYGFSVVEASLRNTRHAIERPLARRMSRLFLRACQAIAPLKRVVFDGR